MGFEIYIKIDDIKGESQDDKHKDWIEVLGFNWGENLPTTSAGGIAAGKVQMHPFQFTARSSKASPYLFLACASGKHFKEAELSMARVVGGQEQDFMVWKLSDVIVSAYRTSGDPSEAMPDDQIELVFAKIEVDYLPFDANGKPDLVIKAGWDVKLNKPV